MVTEALQSVSFSIHILLLWLGMHVSHSRQKQSCSIHGFLNKVVFAKNRKDFSQKVLRRWAKSHFRSRDLISISKGRYQLALCQFSAGSELHRLVAFLHRVPSTTNLVKVPGTWVLPWSQGKQLISSYS